MLFITLTQVLCDAHIVPSDDIAWF